jgi:hypothetical protein
MIKKILIISFLVIALTGCSSPGLKAVNNPLLPENQLVAATNTADTDNIEDESLNGLDDSQEVEGEEAAEGVEANELANEQEQGENLSNGGHQDLDTTDVIYQFEGVE